MIHAVIGWSLNNRLIVLLGAVGLIGVGAYSAVNLNVEAYPDPTPPLIAIITQNPGASPEEMERLVGLPLETALNGMPGLRYLRSTSIAGLCDIRCQFAYGVDYNASRQEVLNRIATVKLPTGVKPELSPWSPTGEIVRYVLDGPGYTPSQLKAVQDWVVNRALKQVSGVIDVVGFGGTVKQYQVLVDSRLLSKNGVTMRQVEDAISRSNANVGGDILAIGTQAHTVRAVGLLGGGVDPLDPANVSRSSQIEAEKLDDIRDVVVETSPQGNPVYVRNVAEVVVGHRPRLGVVGRGDEDDVVEGIVMMRRGEKSLPTAEAVLERMREFEETGLLPKGMKLTVFNKRTDLVHVTTHNVLHNLLVGVALVMAVLLVFLGDLASASIVALVIPLALMFAVTVLYASGQSANLLSLGAVDFGIIVDSSVIIVETIFRHLAEPHEGPPRPITERIIEATHGVERPIFFSTMIIVCAFLPLFTMTGPAGALFGPMAATYAFSILGALGVAVTVAPVLCSFLLRNVSEKETILDRLLKQGYGSLLRLSLTYRVPTLILSAGLFAATVAALPGLGAEFMPELEEGNLWIRALMPRTVSYDEAARVAPRIRRVIASVPEVRGVMSQVGRPDDGTDPTSFFNLEFNVPLKPMEEWREGMTRRKIEEELGDALSANFPGLSFGFSQMIRDNIDEALSGIKGANSVKLFGGDLQTLEETGRRVAEALRSVPGIEDVGMFSIIGQPSLEIRIDRRSCARYGINVDDVEELIDVAIGGREFTQMVEGEKLYDIILRLPRELRDDPEDIGRIPVEIPGEDGRAGARIPIRHLASIEPHKPGAAYIYRENNRRYLPIKFSVRGRDLASAIAEARRKVADPKGGVALPPGYRLEWSGEFAQMQEANRKLAVMVPLSVLLIMLLLYTAFNSFKDALIVMAGVLAALMGGIWALLATRTNFSISAAVGFISIFGVVVQNGVLLVNDFNRMRRENVPVLPTVYRGSVALLRPVLMISLTAILGLLPAALADSVGSQAQKPLAIVVVGGMAVAMVLPQFLIPVLYSYFPHPGPRRFGPDEL